MKPAIFTSVLLASSILLSACAPSQQSETPLLATPTSQTDMYATDSASPAASPSSVPTATPQKGTKQSVVKKEFVTIETAKGTIEMELYPEKAPETVKLFVSKVKSGFYKGLLFHRSDEMVIQGGDPLGNGTGGGDTPSEMNDLAFTAGSVGIARGGNIKINNDSQFFICKNDINCDHLVGLYTNFGKVTKGIDIVNKIAIGDKMLNLTYSEK